MAIKTVNIARRWAYDPNGSGTVLTVRVVYDYLSPDSFGGTFSSNIFAYNDSFVLASPTDIPNNQFATVSEGIAYKDPIGMTAMVDQLTNYAALLGGDTYIAGQIFDYGITPRQIDWNQTNPLFDDFIKNKPTIPTVLAPSQAAATRAFDTAFQVSTTRNARVDYSATIASTLTLTGGAEGAVILEIASNSGFSSNVQELARVTNGNSGALTVGLSLTQRIGGNMSGFVPAGYWVRLRRATASGTPVYTYNSGQEVLI